MIATQILKIDLEIAEYWGQSWQRENDKKQSGLNIMGHPVDKSQV